MKIEIILHIRIASFLTINREENDLVDLFKREVPDFKFWRLTKHLNILLNGVDFFATR